MKAYTLKGINQLEYCDISDPIATEGWAVVKVKAAGICSSDIPRIFYNGTYHFPTIPGHEISGVVDDIVGEENKNWIGKKVSVFPLIPCKKCKACLEQKYEMCNNYDYIGSRRDGGFSEKVLVPIWNLLELQEDATYIENAMLEPLAVALHAVKKVDSISGKTVCVIGTGMIGIAVALWAEKYGAKKVYILGRNNNKADIINNYKGVNYICDTDGLEVDVTFEAVGTPESIEKSIKITNAGGELVLIGNPSGNIELEKNMYWRILRKQIKIIGTWNSSYNGVVKSDWTEARDAIYNKDIDVSKLVTHIYSQDKVGEGLDLMKNHIESYCKVMTIWNE